MKSLPVTVEDEDIEEMFVTADRDRDGKISYEEFKVRHQISTSGPDLEF